MLARLRGRRLRASTRELDGGEVEVRFPIAPTERVPRARRRARPRRRRRLAAAVLRAAQRRRDRRVARGAARSAASSSATSSPATSPAPPIRSTATASRSPACARYALDRGDPGRRRPRRDLRCPASSVLEAAEAALRDGRARALRHLRRLRRDRARRARERQERLLALVRAHGARLSARTASASPSPARGLNATFAPRALPPGSIGFSSQSGALGLALLETADGARARPLRLRLDRQQGGRLVERPARVVGGRRRRPTLVLLYLESFGNPRKFGRARAPRRAREADPRDEERARRRRRAGGELAHGRARRLRRRRRRALPPGGRAPRATRSRSCSTPPRCSRRQPLPRGPARRRAHERGRARHPLRRRLRGGRPRAAGARPTRRAPRSRDAPPGRGERREPGRHARLARPPRPTRRRSRSCSPTRASTRVIVLFVPPVVAGADEVAGGDRARARGRATRTKPVLAVVISADGTPPALRAATRRSPRSPYPESAARALGARRRARRVAAPARRARCRELDGHRPRRGAARRRRGARARDDGWLDPAEARALLERLRHPARRRARRRRRRTRRSPRRASSASRSSSRPPAPGAHKTETRRRRARPARRGRGARGGRADRRARDRPADGARRRRAARRRRPGSGLRPARRLRPGRRARRADRRGRLPDRAAHRRRRRGARHRRQGRPARRAASAARRRPTRPRSPTSSTGSRRLGEDLPEVAELDLNPVLALPDGCVAVDARVRVQPAGTRAAHEELVAACGFSAARFGSPRR